MICPYCRAEFDSADALVLHDIEAHDGLNRMRDSHRAVCQPNLCFCAIADYERVAAKAREPFHCTPETPWKEEYGAKNGVRHSRVREVGEQQDGWPGGDIVTKECQNCGTRWTEELPQ
jgi:hypothetical protein